LLPRPQVALYAFSLPLGPLSSVEILISYPRFNGHHLVRESLFPPFLLPFFIPYSPLGFSCVPLLVVTFLPPLTETLVWPGVSWREFPQFNPSLGYPAVRPFFPQFSFQPFFSFLLPPVRLFGEASLCPQLWKVASDPVARVQLFLAPTPRFVCRLL